MEYSVVIRTLGRAGEYYQRTLDSLKDQSIPPSDVIVYIEEGYERPSETIGVERYVAVPKGMVAQRALDYNEVQTEYCLFLDDDVYLPSDSVEKMYNELVHYKAQVISPCTFANHKAPLKSKLLKSLTGKEVCRIWDDKWAFKVLRTSGFSYNNNPVRPVYESQSNAGPCFFCKKTDFLKIRYSEELWLDKTYYALPDDQIMFYKMYKNGLKILTSFDTGIVHLDAGSTIGQNPERSAKLIFSEYRNKLIFWHRFIYLPEKSWVLKIWSIMAILYAYGIQFLKHSMFYLLGKKSEAKSFWTGCLSGLDYIKSEEYKLLPRI
jgi:glycosyltransferase involved in cell wall biosynthesis